jgi:hypothetical protein
MTDPVVRADEEDKSAKAKEIEDALKADKARKDADKDDRFDKLCDAMEGLTNGMTGLMDRMDALESKGGAPEDPKGDPDEPGKPKEMLVDSDDKPATENQLADAQCKADAVASLWGQQAPKPLSGESLLGYRRRLLKPFIQYSNAFAKVDIYAVKDKATFDGIETKVYADATEASKRPDVAPGMLREVVRTRNGHTYTEFYGDARVWLDPAGNNFMGQAVTGFGKTK